MRDRRAWFGQTHYCLLGERPKHFFWWIDDFYFPSFFPYRSLPSNQTLYSTFTLLQTFDYCIYVWEIMANYDPSIFARHIQSIKVRRRFHSNPRQNTKEMLDLAPNYIQPSYWSMTMTNKTAHSSFSTVTLIETCPVFLRRSKYFKVAGASTTPSHFKIFGARHLNFQDQCQTSVSK